MKTNPFNDAWQFLLGRTGDHLYPGLFFSWVITFGFIALIAASFYIAWNNWQSDPTQRTSTHFWTFVMRFFIGIMWFQGSLWKLPLPISDGLTHWTQQIAEYAAFGLHSWIAANIFVPGLILINPIVFATELTLGICLMLGFLVRPMAFVGMLFTLHLWLGLYKHPAEWPWLFVFLFFTQGFFLMHSAGKSLGLDAMLTRRPIGPLAGDGAVAKLYRRLA